MGRLQSHYQEQLPTIGQRDCTIGHLFTDHKFQSTQLRSPIFVVGYHFYIYISMSLLMCDVFVMCSRFRLRKNVMSRMKCHILVKKVMNESYTLHYKSL